MSKTTNFGASCVAQHTNNDVDEGAGASTGWKVQKWDTIGL